MTRVISAGSFSAFIAAATISAMAQTPAPQQSTTTSTDHRISVTGCLRQAPAAATDTTGNPGTAGTTGTTGAAGAPASATDPANAKFVLANATISPGSGDSNASASATTTEKGAPQTYRLVANPVALGPHVGKKLELTGTLDQSAAASSTSTSEASGPLLRVEAGKVLAASCEN